MVVVRFELGDLALRKLGWRCPDVPLHALAARRGRQRTNIVVETGACIRKDGLFKTGRNLNRRLRAGGFGELCP